MRELRFASLTDDARHLVLESVDGGDHFRLPIDDARRATNGVAVSPVTAVPVATTAVAPAAPPTPEVEVSPRDIQVRVRAGASPQDVADEFGLPLDRVLRFAAPVVAERLRIADEARRSRAHRPDATDPEAKAVIFGEAVDARFGAYGLDPATVGWDSHRREDGEWVIVAHWLGGDDRRTAHWIFHRAARSVTPVDEPAADLLSDRPIRPVAPPAPPRPTLVGAPPLRAGVVAFPPMPDAVTAPVPIVDHPVHEVFDQEAADETDVLAAPTPPELSPDFDEPPLPLGIADPGGRPAAGTLRSLQRTEPSEDEKAVRSRIPSWDDILLGVRRKSD